MTNTSSVCLLGFGFVTFTSEDCVEDVCREHFHSIKGKTVSKPPQLTYRYSVLIHSIPQVEAKKAHPRPGRDHPDGTSINPVKTSRSQIVCVCYCCSKLCVLFYSENIHYYLRSCPGAGVSLST